MTNVIAIIRHLMIVDLFRRKDMTRNEGMPTGGWTVSLFLGRASIYLHVIALVGEGTRVVTSSVRMILKKDREGNA